jgi:hypothetical protein
MELHAIKSFYDSRQGLVELDDDTLSIVRQVRELYGNRVKVSWEPTTEWFVFSENCNDGTERLIFTTPELDGRALERLLMADSQARLYQDAYDKNEQEQDEALARRDSAGQERLRDHGERLAHGLKKDDIGPYPLQVSVSGRRKGQNGKGKGR